MGLLHRLKQSRRLQTFGQRMYAAARVSRLTSNWQSSTTSADSELTNSLRVLRARCRALVRDAGHAKRAKRIVQNNVIGTGIGLQARVLTSRMALNERVNDEIEAAWDIWTRPENCHTGGSFHFADLERAAVGQVFEAGEIFTRKHFRVFGPAEIPLALELIEPERLADQFQPSAPDSNNLVRLGIESDRFHRPVAYVFRTVHPGDISLDRGIPDRIERVPADQIIHLRIIDRWPQTRGEPWLHAVARRLNDMEGYAEAEIVAARGAASYMGTIESPQEVGEETESGQKEWTIEPGIIERLSPGEKFNFVAPNRPNANMDAFMRLMLREVAAGADVSYESLSRDYSQSNYSSSRLALLDDRDLWRVLQMWFIRAFRQPLHRIWLQQAVLAGMIPSISVESYAANPEKYEAARFKPRGWTWIDPTKEVKAYKEAIKAGLTTQTHVIAMTGEGRDIWDVLTEREEELKLAKEKGLTFDVDPRRPSATAAPATPAAEPNKPDDGDDGTDDGGDGSAAQPGRQASLPN